MTYSVNPGYAKASKCGYGCGYDRGVPPVGGYKGSDLLINTDGGSYPTKNNIGSYISGTSIGSYVSDISPKSDYSSLLASDRYNDGLLTQKEENLGSLVRNINPINDRRTNNVRQKEFDPLMIPFYEKKKKPETMYSRQQTFFDLDKISAILNSYRSVNR